MVIFTKMFGTLDPHLPMVWDKVPKNRFVDTSPNWKFSFFPSFWGCITLTSDIKSWTMISTSTFPSFVERVFAYAATNRCPVPPIYYLPMAYCPPPQRNWIDLEIFMTTTKTSWTRCYNVWAGIDCNSIDDPAIDLDSRSKDGNEGSCTVKQI